MLWGGFDIPEGPSSDVPAIYKIPPAIVTGDATLVVDGNESDPPETDEEKLATREEAMYKGLEYHEADLIQLFMENSVRDTSMIGPRGSQPTIGGDTGTNAQIERAQKHNSRLMTFIFLFTFETFILFYSEDTV
uniref:Polyprotein protein n=1 Tax=Solanum tuberosum TaxID=4113 RepID=M1DKV3_SOLTU